MARHVLIAALAGAMLAAASAHAQESGPPLDGAPPPLQVPKPAAPRAPVPTPRPAAPDASLKAEAARLARQAEDQRAEQDRLTRLAADLDARERALAAEEAAYTRKLAELDRAPPVTAAAPSRPDASPRYRITYDDARRACTRAGMAEATGNDFYSARYDSAPRYFERQREMRGRMRMDDREGYLTVDTVCQLDANGAVVRFEALP